MKKENVFANIFLKISDYFREKENPDYKEAAYFFTKAIEYNANHLKMLTKSEIDDLFDKYQNKSVAINKALLSCELELLQSDEDSTKVILQLSERYFLLEGMANLFFKSVKL